MSTHTERHDYLYKNVFISIVAIIMHSIFIIEVLTFYFTLKHYYSIIKVTRANNNDVYFMFCHRITN